jgi:23S rRNA (cytosine1962-C5)-methyltransferase
MDSTFANRLRKNWRHFRRWAQTRGLTAFRVYDFDIPEYPYVVEWYDGRVHLVEFPPRRARREGGMPREEVFAAVASVLEVAPERIYVKTHSPQPWGQTQYGREGHGSEHFTVEESGLKFWVNLGDFLDTGLFLDHRNTRARVREEARGKRFLNLFAYTGSFSVYAAAGGAKSTTTVDLSNRYIDWAQENLEVNALAGPQHSFVVADATRWLAEEVTRQGAYDLIVLDPPSFSTSKRMTGSFNVQRDHPRLLTDTLALLAPGGVLYFSTNFRGFELNTKNLEARFEELTPKSIPDDFHERDIHRCWRISRA